MALFKPVSKLYLEACEFHMLSLRMNQDEASPMEENDIRQDIVALSADIVSSYVGANQLPAADLPDLLRRIHGTLAELSGAAVPEPEAAEPALPPRPKPAVPVSKSVTPDAIICLEDGKAFKTLKRHLKTAYDMTPDEYRARWNLPDDYPMVAPNYSKQRAETARRIGLGRKS